MSVVVVVALEKWKFSEMAIKAHRNFCEKLLRCEFMKSFNLK